MTVDTMESSRLIVKNLANSVTQEKLKQHFGEKGEVTDVQLKYTPDGKFRHFAFIGFKNGETAQEAQQYFDKTFVGASRITVELCHSLGEKPLPVNKVVREREKAEKKKLKKSKLTTEEDDEKPAKKKRKEDEILEKCEQDPAFLEFLTAHKKTAATWGNDTLVDELMKLKEKKGKKKESKVEDEEEEDDEPEEEEAQGKKKKSKKMAKANDEGGVEVKSVKEKRKKAKLDAEFFTLKLRDVPKKVRKKDIKAFFAPLKLKSIRFPIGLRGIVFVGFATESDQIRGLQKNKSFIMGNQIKIRAHNAINSEANSTPRGKFEQLKEDLVKVAEPVGESGRIFLRNLSYTTNEDEVTKLFGEFGPITEIHLPLDRITRKTKGFGFVSFMMPEHADQAFKALDGTIFQGRMLHLLPSKSKDDPIEDELQATSSYKIAKDIKLKQSAGSSHNWNALFLGQSTVAKVISEKYGVSREEMLLDKTDDQDSRLASIGVRMALAETEIVADTKAFLEKNGVCLEAFDSIEKKAERSKTVILVKNLPANTSAKDLKQLFLKHGVLNRIILPPSGVTGIVEFAEPSEARSAFMKLAYSKFLNLPLYLEWAPIGVFARPADERQVLQLKADAKAATEKEEQSNQKQDMEPVSKIMAQVEEFEPVDENAVPELDTTLFVKNLNFRTLEEPLKKHFMQCGPVYSVTVARKKNPSDPDHLLSMGYGFVQYYRSKDASKALTTLNETMLENHILELKPSTRTLVKENADNAQKKGAGSKLLVRNVPFQATPEEITDLFKTFGKLKAVRLPKKMTGGGEHRGFAFIDYYTESDAKKAFGTLSKSTHLYGRRLVIEWASQDETVEDLRAKTARLASLSSKDGAEEIDHEGGSTKKRLNRYFQTLTLPSKPEQEEEDVDPQVVVIPIVSSIFVFPLVVLLVICCLKKRAARRRQLARLAQREDPWNERSCASIVQRSPPLSVSGGCSGRYGVVDGDLTTTVELVTPDGPATAFIENEPIVILPRNLLQRQASLSS